LFAPQFVATWIPQGVNLEGERDHAHRDHHCECSCHTPVGLMAPDLQLGSARTFIAATLDAATF
jgi:hypothetical protein